jgi:hypothetical protein
MAAVQSEPVKTRTLRSTSTASRDLYDMFYRDQLYTFNMRMNEQHMGMITVGQRNIFFHASTLPKDMMELKTNSCIHLYSISSFANDGKQVLYLDSYYDVDPSIKSLCKQHHSLFGETRNATLFKIFDVIADEIGYDTIELVDGSRTTLPDGREWNLRVLNNLLGKGQTFYEKFGFTPIYKVPPFEGLRIPLDKLTKEYVRNHMEIPVDKITLPVLVKHLYTKGGESGQWDPEDAAVIKFIIGAVDDYIKKIYKDDTIYPNAYRKTVVPSFNCVVDTNTITFSTKGGRKRKTRKSKKNKNKRHG